MVQLTALATPTYRLEIRKRHFFDNFGDGTADSLDWSVQSGTWSVASVTQWDAESGNVYKQTDPTGTRVVYSNHPLNITDYTIESVVQIRTASGAAGIIGRRIGNNYYAFKVTQGSVNNLRLENQAGTLIGSLASATISQNTWYGIRMTFSGTTITCAISTDFVTYTDVITATDSTLAYGACGLKTYTSEVWFDDVSQYTLKKTILKSNNIDLSNATWTEKDGNQADDANIVLQNINGTNYSLIECGNEIHIWAGYEENTPSLVKRFIGTIEEVTPSLSSNGGDEIILLANDYLVDLLEKPITKLYINRDVGYIFRDIINTNANYITTSTVDAPDTGKVLDRKKFNHVPAKECLDELALIGDGTNSYQWLIDKRLRGILRPKTTTSSGKNLTVGTNIIAQQVGKRIQELKNRIIVYGIGRPDTANVVQQTTQNATVSFGKATTNQKVAQTFSANTSDLFDLVVKPMASGGTPVTAQKIRCTIQELDGSNLPNGTILKESIVTTEAWADGVTAGSITIPVDSALEVGTSYAFVLELQDTAQQSDTNFFNVGTNSAGGYGSGARLYYNGAAWVGGGDGVDLYFQLYPRLPNTVRVEDTPSQQLFGVRVLEDYQKREDIRTKQAATDRANSILAEKKLINFQGPITTMGLEDVDVGKTISVTIPNSGITAQDFPSAELRHSIDKQGFLTTVNLNKAPPAFTDIVAEQDARIKALEAKDLDDGLISLSPNQADNITLTQTPSTELTCARYYINDSFIMGHTDNGVMYLPQNAFILNSMENSAQWTQDAGSVALTITNDSTAGHFWEGTQGVSVTWAATSGNAIVVSTTAMSDMKDVVNSYCYDFSGSGQYITLSNESTYDFTPAMDFTINVWINADVDAAKTNRKIISKAGTSATITGWDIQWNHANARPQVKFGDGTTQVATTVFNSSASTWIMLTVTHDSSTKTLSIYENGVFKQSVSTASLTNATVNNNNVRIGHRADAVTTGSEFDGRIANAAIWNRLLNTTEITALNTSPNVISATNLIGWWKLKDAPLGTAVDSSSSASNGTVTSATSSSTWFMPWNGTIGMWFYSATPASLNAQPQLKFGSTSGNYCTYAGKQYAWKVSAVESSFALTTQTPFETLILFDLDLPSSYTGKPVWTAPAYAQLNMGIAAAGAVTMDLFSCSQSDVISYNVMGVRRTLRTANTIAGAST